MYDILDYFEAKNVKEVTDYLVNNENSMIIAGGTDILIKSREGKKGYCGVNLVGVTRVDEMTNITMDSDNNIIIGASCTFSYIEKHHIITKNIPILSTAVGTVGGPQVRNTGTIGGNIANGVTSADSASTLFVLNAIVVISGVKGIRQVSIHDFYISAGKVSLEKGDVIVSFKICKEDYTNFKGHYIKFAQRNAMDIATLGCATLIKVEDNIIKELRIGFGVAGPTPLRATIAEEMAVGMNICDENLEAIGNKCLESSKARTSWRGSKEYRENLIVELSQRAIKISLGRDLDE